MDFNWTNLIIQLPIVAAFMYFMLKWQDSNAVTTAKQHEYWQDWLKKRDEDAVREREEWREFIRSRDEQFRTERAELLAAMKGIEAQLESLTNFTLLVYMHVTPDKNEIVETLKEFSKRTDG